MDVNVATENRMETPKGRILQRDTLYFDVLGTNKLHQVGAPHRETAIVVSVPPKLSLPIHDALAHDLDVTDVPCV